MKVIKHEKERIVSGGYKLGHFVSFALLACFASLFFAIGVFNWYLLIVFIIPLCVCLMLLNYAPFSYKVRFSRDKPVIFCKKTLSFKLLIDIPAMDILKICVSTDDFIGRVFIVCANKKIHLITIMRKDAIEIGKQAASFFGVRFIEK